MNVKHSRCVNRISFICFATALLCAFTASAQDYFMAWDSNPWNDGKGATGIRCSEASGAYAESYGSYVMGGLRGNSDAATAWTAGVKTASVRHFGKFSTAGSFGYEQMWGQQMCGSMLIRPGFYPVDIYEFTPGPKLRQSYSVAGQLSVDVAPSWRLGLGTDFLSSNMAKRKDLRHTTYLLDFSLFPGVQYHSGDFAVALNYLISKNGETVRAEQVGTKVASYDAFLDKGLYYGVQQLWTGSGTHLNEAGVDGFPLSEFIQGGSLQLSSGGFYFGVMARIREGRAGEKQKVWYRFNGWDLDADLDYRFRTSAGVHRLAAGIVFFAQDNDEYALEQRTEGGVVTTVTIGSNRVFSRSTATASLGYGFTGRSWGLDVSASLTDKEGAASVMYPFLTVRKLLIPAVDMKFSASAGRFGFGLSSLWSCGFLTESDRLVAMADGVIGSPMRLEQYSLDYDELMTVHKLALAPSLRYTLAFGLYAEAYAWWNHGFGVQRLGADRLEAGLKLGYIF